MSLPLFGPGQDPGPSFSELLKRSGVAPPAAARGTDVTQGQVPHGTTIVALRYAEGPSA